MIQEWHWISSVLGIWCERWLLPLCAQSHYFCRSFPCGFQFCCWLWSLHGLAGSRSVNRFYFILNACPRAKSTSLGSSTRPSWRRQAMLERVERDCDTQSVGHLALPSAQCEQCKRCKKCKLSGGSVKLSDLKGSFMVYEAWSLCVPRTRSREEKMGKLKPQRGHLLESDIRSAALKCSSEKHYVAHKNSSNKGASRVYVSIGAYNHMHRFMQKSLAITEKINCILVKGSLEVKLPTIWRDEKQRRHRCVFYIVTSKFVSRHSGV